MQTILTPVELKRLEREHQSSGISANQVLEVFRARGIALSEGTFRKYVQAGLLPRSRRVGSKGRNRGSRGVYPVAVIRRINAIKAMMAEGMTLEEIRGSFLFVRGELDTLEQSASSIAAGLERSIAEAPIDSGQREKLLLELQGAREQSARLVHRLERLASRIVAARVAAQDSDEPEGT